MIKVSAGSRLLETEEWVVLGAPLLSHVVVQDLDVGLLLLRHGISIMKFDVLMMLFNVLDRRLGCRTSASVLSPWTRPIWLRAERMGAREVDVPD